MPEQKVHTLPAPPMPDDALEVVTPPVKEVTTGGKTLLISPICIGELGAFTKACAVFAHLFDAEGNLDMMGAVVSHSEDIKEAVRIGSRVDREWLDQQHLDTLVVLAGAVFEVNTDFFVRAVLPVMEGVLKSAMSGPLAGLLQSIDLSALDTTDET